jgi:hypothetical protein
MDNKFDFGINWQDGMMIDGSHFRHLENYLEHRLGHLFALARNAFGLLPAQAETETTPLKIQLHFTDEGQLTIELHRCFAVAPSGVIVWWDTSWQRTDPVICSSEFSTKSSAVYDIIISADHSQRHPIGEPDPEEEPFRVPYAVPGVTLRVPDQSGVPLPENALKIGEILVEEGTPVLSDRYIPPCFCPSASPAFGEIVQVFGESISTIFQSAVRISGMFESESKSRHMENYQERQSTTNLCQELIRYLAPTLDSYRSLALTAPPIYTYNYFKGFIRILGTTMLEIMEDDRRKKMYSFWKDAGDFPDAAGFENLMSEFLKGSYVHDNCRLFVDQVQELLERMVSHFDRLVQQFKTPASRLIELKRSKAE